MLALAFLLLIGVLLTAEAFHAAIPKGYVYFAMAFSIVIEMLDLWRKRNAHQRLAAEGYRDAACLGCPYHPASQPDAPAV